MGKTSRLQEVQRKGGGRRLGVPGAQLLHVHAPRAGERHFFASRVRNALACDRGGYLNDGGEPVCGAFELCLHHSRRGGCFIWPPRSVRLNTGCVTGARARCGGGRPEQCRQVSGASEWKWEQAERGGNRWNARTNEWNIFIEVGAPVALVEWDFPSPLLLGWRVPGRSCDCVFCRMSVRSLLYW